MGIVTFFGKLLIAVSIIFEAYLLYADKSAIDSFDKQLGHALTGCDCLTPEILKMIKEHLRLVVAGFLASSILFVLVRSWVLKLPTFIGLSVLLWIEHHGVFKTIPTEALLGNTAFWHSLGVIGAIIYLAGAECNSCTTTATTASTKKSDPSKEATKAKEAKKTK